MPVAPPRPSLPRRGPGVLHHLAAVLNLAGRRLDAGEPAAPMRRRRQRLALAQRLLDPLPPGLRAADRGSEAFWRVLRWGGVGLLVARLLGR